uniref:Uncharacterized protein n=1 Tax=Nicotiana tabacum TaxID=4097 RepID=A0A1S3Y8S4_TOBAC|nr:PREDICTED: uncharacterized protein LOC107773565 [Nicotiana tabacum]
MRVDNEETVFNVYKAIKLPCHYEELSMIPIVEVDEKLIDQNVYLDDSLEKALMLFDSLEINDEVKEMMHIDASCVYIQGLNPFEPLNRLSGPPPKPSNEEAPKLELKPLPSHLQYAYLGGSDTLLVIVSSDLSKLHEEKFLKVPHEHKRAIGWMMYFHFMVREDIVLGNKVSKNGLQVDKAKVKAIEKFPPPTSVKGIHSFLGHASFYHRFIKDFSKFSSPICSLLEKDIPFKYDGACLKAFEKLKK